MPPKDFRDAIRGAVDIAFVLSSQAMGKVHARRSGNAWDAERWKPTIDERNRVATPAHRIAKRHLRQDMEVADAMDICLIAAGTGAYLQRAAFGLDPLEELPDDQQ